MNIIASLRIIMKITNMLQLFNAHNVITDYWNVVDILVVEKNTGNNILSTSFDTHTSEILDCCGASVPPFPVTPLPSSFSFPPILQTSCLIVFAPQQPA